MHIQIAKNLAKKISEETDFEVITPVMLNTVCFRYLPEGKNEEQINRINEELNHKLNDSGKLYLTHTVLNNKYTLRMVTAQTNVTQNHVDKAWNFIKETARGLQD